MSQLSQGRRWQIGIVPRMLIASLSAVVIAVVVVQLWTLHLVSSQQMKTAQRLLTSQMAILQHELGSHPVWQRDASGALLLDGQPLRTAADAVATVRALTGADATIFSGDTRIATTLSGSNGESLIGTRLGSGPIRKMVLDRAARYTGIGTIHGVAYLTDYVPLLDQQGRPVGILFVGIRLTEAYGVVTKIVRESILVGLIVIVCVGAFRWIALRSSMRPLTILAASVREIARGELDVPTPCAERTDQLGEIGRAIEALRLGARAARDSETRIVAERRARDRSQKAMDQLTRDFATTISGVLDKLGHSADQVRNAAVDMTEVANRTRDDMQGAAAEAETSARNLSSVADATDALTANGGEISRQVGQVSIAAESAVLQARTTVETVEGLDEAARQISAVIGLIGQISGQTNLLALNATIEAARAGDAGKGFAVVASEVKQLAGQTDRATARVGEQIDAIQAATTQAVSAVRTVTGAILQAGQAATTIAASVNDQGAATRQIAQQVQTVSQATINATRAMRDAADLAARSEETSRSVLATADHVAAVTGTLRAEVDDFIAATTASWQSGDRRRYERIEGGGLTATLTCTTHGNGSGSIADISLGGISVQCSWPCDVGNEIMVGLPGTGQPVSARIVDSRHGLLHVAFRQDRTTLDQVGRTIALIENGSAPAGRLAA